MKNIKTILAFFAIVCSLLLIFSSCDLINPPAADEHQHSLTKHEGKDPTCTKQGTEVYYTCDCGRGFSDPEAKNQIKRPIVIEALGHDYVIKTSGKLDYSASTGYYDASGLTVMVVCDRCNKVEEDKLEYFNVKPNGTTAGSYIISAEWEGQSLSTVYGAETVNTDCVCDSFKVSGTLSFDADDGSVDTSGLVISDAVCTDCGEAITKASIDVSGAFTDGVVIYCGGASLTLPALNVDNYTVSSTRAKPDYAPIVTTTFVSDEITVKVISNDCLVVGGVVYSRYELSRLNSENVSVTYDGDSYIYNAIQPITLTQHIASHGCMLTVLGDVTLNLSARWTHNNGIVIGSDDKAAKVIVNVNGSNGIFLWDGANIVVNEGSSLDVTGTDPYAIWTGSRGSHITVDGTLVSHGHIFLAPEVNFTHPDGDYYNSNPNLYVRKGDVTVEGNVLVNFIQVGSVKNDYTGKLTVKNGYLGCYSSTDGDVNNKVHQTRWIFSKGELNFENTGNAIDDAMKTDQNYKDRVIAFDSGIKVKATGSYTHLLAHAWGSFTTLAIHSDATFALPAETTMYEHENTYSSCYVGAWSEATVTIDGVEKTVWVANESLFRENEKFTYSQDDLIPTVNADGTRSAAKVVATGSYTTVSGETRIGDWLFKKATDTDGNVIYYYSVNAHYCESVCVQCGKCFNEDCLDNACIEKCVCYLDEIIGSVEGGYIYNLMSFNIRRTASEGNPINNWDSRKAAVMNFINNSRAHLIGLQEVTLSQFNYITDNLSSKYMALYFPREGGSDPEGLAIVFDATVFNIISDDRYWLSDTPDIQSKGWGESYYRIAFVVVFENRVTGEYIKMVNTHGPLEDLANTNAYKLIMDRSVSDKDHFVFLCGDFNASQGEIGYVPVADELQDCRVTAEESPNRDHLTYQGWGSYVDGETPENIIDFCFVSEGEKIEVLTYRVRTDRWGDGNMLSDHYAIQTTVLVKQ